MYGETGLGRKRLWSQVLVYSYSQVLVLVYSCSQVLVYIVGLSVCVKCYRWRTLYPLDKSTTYQWRAEYSVHIVLSLSSAPHHLSLNSDWTVVGVLAVCVSLYALVLAVCRRADLVSERNDKVHYLSDNSPSDPLLYAVNIHTGLRSAANMTAKVGP